MRNGIKVDFAWREDSLNFDFIKEHREEEKLSWVPILEDKRMQLTILQLGNLVV